MNWRVLTKVEQRGNAEKGNAAAVRLGVQARARMPKGNAAAVPPNTMAVKPRVRENVAAAMPGAQERPREPKGNAAKVSAAVPAKVFAT